MFDNEVTWLTKCFRYQEYYKVESIANCYLSPSLCIFLVILILFVVNCTLLWTKYNRFMHLFVFLSRFCLMIGQQNKLKNIITDQSKCTFHDKQVTNTHTNFTLSYLQAVKAIRSCVNAFTNHGEQWRCLRIFTWGNLLIFFLNT